MAFAPPFPAAWDTASGKAVPAFLWSSLAVALGYGTAVASGYADIDRLGFAVMLLTLFLGAIVASFSLRQMRADTRSGLFFFKLASLVASVVLFLGSGNLAGFAAGWVASGWLLAGLIGHSRSLPEARVAARRAIVAFLIGDMALTGAFFILFLATNSTDFAVIFAGLPSLSASAASAASLLLLVAAMSRCATPPFSGWLLSSMTAPTPVSALMHAGMVNAGGFLLIRCAPILEAAPAVRIVAVALGLVGAIYGIGIMLVRPDVKRALAGSTVSQMGFMVMSCGFGAYAAALWHIIAHGLFKAWLFLGAGSNIGIRKGSGLTASTRRQRIAVTAVTLIAGVALIATNHSFGSFIPAALGIATALLVLLGCQDTRLPGLSRLTVTSLLLALIAFNGLGLAMARLVAGPDGPVLLPPWALLTMLATFLWAWLWQQQRLADDAPLPAPLYVHLLNAGSLRQSGEGETK